MSGAATLQVNDHAADLVLVKQSEMMVRTHPHLFLWRCRLVVHVLQGGVGLRGGGVVGAPGRAGDDQEGRRVRLVTGGAGGGVLLG